MRDPENAAGRVNGPGEKLPPARSRADDERKVAGFAGDLQPLLKRREVEEILRVSARKLWSLTASGEIAHLRIGRAVRYRIEDVLAYVERMRKEANSGR
jgi:excisionase family DNA binding protein